MPSPRWSRLVPLAFLAVVLARATPAAHSTPCEFDGVDHIVAVGDVHGAYTQFLEILQAAGLIDAHQRWTGGKTHLVQAGDVLDRGADSRKALDLLQKLAKDAAHAGGRVHQLIGNHEAMRMLGDFRYTTPGEYAAFQTSDSEDLRKQVIERLPEADRAGALASTPLGMVELIQAFRPTGSYGGYLRTLNAVEKIDGIVFVHGGISAAVAPLSCEAINDTVRRELTEDLVKTKNAPGESLTAKADGPLWYRGLAEESDAFGPTADQILAAQHAQAIVIAHTVQPDGHISMRFGGKVFAIDTGMQPAYVPNGQPSALDIQGGVFTAIYRNGRQVLRGGVPASGARQRP